MGTGASTGSNGVGASGAAGPRVLPKRRAVPTEPAFGLTYGEVGLRKTTGCAEAFAARGVFICRPGGLLPASSYLGLRADLRQRSVVEVHVATLYDVLRVMPVLVSKGYQHLVIDDLSMIADDTVKKIDDDDELRGWDKWRELRNLIIDLRVLGRKLACNVWLNAHSRDPYTDDHGVPQDGGPLLPSKNQTSKIPHEVDLVWRVVEDPSRPGRTRAARAAIDAGATPRWWAKDRHSVAPPRGPANLRVLLERAGYVLGRPAGLEWQDAVVVGMREALAARVGPVEQDDDFGGKVLDRPATLRALYQTGARLGVEAQRRCLSRGWAPEHISWALRDGMAHAELDLLADPVRALLDDLFWMDAPADGRADTAAGGNAGTSGNAGTGGNAGGADLSPD